MSGTGRFPSIDAEPEQPTDPPWWTVLWHSLTPAEWAVTTTALAAVYATLWWLAADPIVAVFVMAAVSGAVLVAVTLAWTWRTLRAFRRDLEAVRQVQNADRADFLDHVAAERNRRLDGVPVQRTDDGSD